MRQLSPGRRPASVAQRNGTADESAVIRLIDTALAASHHGEFGQPSHQGRYTPDVRDEGTAVPEVQGRFWASLAVPPMATGPAGSEAVREIFLTFDQPAQRLRSIL